MPMYTLSVRNLNPAAPAGRRPLIGPEIGPDPRSGQALLKLSVEPVLPGANGVRYDFNHGFRVKMPPDDREYLLETWDLDSLLPLDRVVLRGGQTAIGNRKYFIRYRIEVSDGETRRLLFRHDFDCGGKPVNIVIPDGGLGDNLAWLPYAEAFRKKYRARVTCVCGEWLIRLVRGQYPELDFRAVGANPSAQASYASYFCAIFSADRKDWRPVDHQHSGMQGSVALLLGLDPVPRKVRLPRPKPRAIAEPYVCISTMATNPCKYWNYPDGWNLLCRRLKRLGFRVLAIDRDRGLRFGDREYFTPSEAEDFTGLKPIRERMELLQNAEFFVGLPSGLSWLAWNCDIPVVMLSGFTLDGAEFPTPYRVTNFNACHGCWNDSTLFFDMHAAVWCPRHAGTPREIECTRAITPKMVLETVDRVPAVARRLRPKVSIAIPVYNTPPEMLTPMLDSVLAVAERYPAAEILLHDDASDDTRVAALLEYYRAGHPELIRLSKAGKNAGIAASRQALLDAAQGRYLLSFDADDLMLPFDLAAAVDYLETHPEVNATYPRKYFFSGREQPEGVGARPYSPFLAFFQMMEVPNAALFRVEAMREVGGYAQVPSGIADDVALFCRLAARGVCELAAEPRVLARRHCGSFGKKFDCGLPEAYRDFTASLASAYPREMRQLEKCVIPEGPAHRSAGLAGAALSMHSDDPEYVEKLCAAALVRFPGDYGVWKIWLLTLFNRDREEEFRRELSTAAGQFSRRPFELFAMLEPVLEAAASRNWRALPPEKPYAAARAEFMKWPDSALAGLRTLFPAPRPVRRGAPSEPVRISVIICVFRGRYLRECVDSVARAFRDYGRTEILLYEDASPEPGLASLLDQAAAAHPDLVRVWHGRKNTGVALGRRFLVEHARGEYIVSFDHDDVMLPFDVDKVVNFMDSHPETAASYAPKYLFSENEGYLREIHGSAYSPFCAFFGPRVNINAAFLRKSMVAAAGGFLQVNGDRGSGWDDIYLFTRLAQRWDISFDPEPRTLYRIHPDQITAPHPPWDDWITRQVCETHPALYARILAGDIPDVHGADFRVVRGLMGAAVYRNQRSRKITDPIFQAALREFPEDSGVWTLYFTLLSMDGGFDELCGACDDALEHCRHDPAAQLEILYLALHSYSMRSRTPPEDQAEKHRKLQEKYLALPAMAGRVLESLSSSRCRNKGEK